jgi:hypothetical protein
MEDKLNKLIIRSAEFDQAISALLSQAKIPPLPRCRLSVAMAGISIEHADSIRMLIYSKNFTSAMTLLRSQFEVTARSIWLLYAADDEYIIKHDSPLTVENDGYSDGPDVAKMLKDLDVKPNVPKQASVYLSEFKSQSWRALGSYIHGGKHPLKRKQDGYPVHLLTGILQQSTGLLLMAAMTVIAMTGDQKLADKYWNLQNEYKDCLAPYIPKPA